MDEEDIKRLIYLAEDRINNPRSKEDILNTFINAGILDTNGNFTENYPTLKLFDNK